MVVEAAPSMRGETAAPSYKRAVVEGGIEVGGRLRLAPGARRLVAGSGSRHGRAGWVAGRRAGWLLLAAGSVA